jgi:predicted nucleic acid-binding protein
MSGGEVFFDTSVLLYLLLGEGDKAERVEQLLLRGGAINVQVLNEFAAVALRKRSLSPAELRDILETTRELCDTHPLTVEIHERGLEMLERYGYSLYDSMIIAAALQAGCRTLYSEDLQHGQLIEKRLKVVNPFLDS